MNSNINDSGSSVFVPAARIGKPSIFLRDLSGQTMFSEDWSAAVDFFTGKSAIQSEPHRIDSLIRVSIDIEGSSQLKGEFRDYDHALGFLDFAATRIV